MRGKILRHRLTSLISRFLSLSHRVG
jgi:hypothetical protein